MRGTFKGLILISICFASIFNVSQAFSVTPQESYIFPASEVPFPLCEDSTITEWCIETFEIDSNNDGIFEDQSHNPDFMLCVSNQYSNWDTSGPLPYSDFAMTISIQQNQSNPCNMQETELSPTFPEYSHIRVAINTRNYLPESSQAWGLARLNSVGIKSEESGNIIRIDSSTLPFTYQFEWSDDEGEYFEYTDRKSGWYLQIWNDSDRTSIYDKTWYSSNADTFGLPYFNRDSMTWEFQTSASPYRPDGSPNIIEYKAFIPDSAIAQVYGVDPESLVGLLKMIRVDGDIRTEENVEIMRVTEPVPGIIVSLPQISLITNQVSTLSAHNVLSSKLPLKVQKFNKPRHILKSRSKLLRAPKILNLFQINGSKKIRIKSSIINSAISYQAACFHGSESIYGTSSNNKVVLKNLHRGNWNCQIRGIGKIGGKWSQVNEVKIE